MTEAGFWWSRGWIIGVPRMPLGYSITIPLRFLTMVIPSICASHPGDTDRAGRVLPVTSFLATEEGLFSLYARMVILVNCVLPQTKTLRTPCFCPDAYAYPF